MLTLEQAVAGLEHSAGIVRELAWDYFQNGWFSAEETWNALRRVADAPLRDSQFLDDEPGVEVPPDAAACDWIIDRLRRTTDLTNAHEDNLRVWLTGALVSASPALLAPRLEEILLLPAVPREMHRALRGRVLLARLDWDSLWLLLEEATQALEWTWPSRGTREYLRNLCRAMSECAQPNVDQVLSHLGRLALDDGEEDDRPELEISYDAQVVEIAGRLRLAESVPAIMECVFQEREILSLPAEQALVRIGEPALEWIVARTRDAATGFEHMTFASVLKSLPLPAAGQAALELARWEATPPEFRECYAQAAIHHGHMHQLPELLAVVEQLGDPQQSFWYCKLWHELAERAEIFGWDFPERAKCWQAALVAARLWRGGNAEVRRLRADWQAPFRQAYDEDSYDEPRNIDRGEESGPAPEEPRFAQPDYHRVVPLTRTAPRVGRNEPCPCGSGKKFKNCCIDASTDGAGQGSEDEFTLDLSVSGKASRQKATFPSGTISWYGPNDLETTKVVATVVLYHGATPIVKKFTGPKVKHDPKVRRKIREFFQEHRVDCEVESGGNVGCSHEPGRDYPAGEACPVCTYWTSQPAAAAGAGAVQARTE